MSEKTLLHVYYGEGQIMHGSEGVSLEQYNCVERWVTRPGDKSFAALHKWLVRGFDLNAVTSKVDVMALASRASVGYFWELVPIRSTDAWRKYVQFASERGQPLILFVQTEAVQAEVDGGEWGSEPGGMDGGEDEEGDVTVHMHEGPSGQAEEGELLPVIVEQIELEDHETEDLPDEDSSDEEIDVSGSAVPVPAEWNNWNSEEFVARERYNVPWELHENVVSQGAIYASKDALRDAVK